MRDGELTAVFSAEDITAHAEAEVLKSLLNSAGIPSIVRYTPPTFQRPGGVRLLVVDEDREEAEAIIREALEAAP